MNLQNRILFQGDDKTAYRDPAVFYHDGTFHLFFTLVEKENGTPYLYLAATQSRDLVHFSPIRKLTPKDRRLNYSSPGNVIEYNGEYVLCLQTYPREHGEKYANERARLFTMHTKDFLSWTEPRLIPVKGNIPEEEMGRMIDPFLLADPDDDQTVYCFYKQNGVSVSRTRNLRDWEFLGHANAGENACVLHEEGVYYLFHSPDDGIAVKRSRDLLHWEDVCAPFFLDAKEHDWSRGRVTAAFVLDMRAQCGKYLMFYHASGPQDESVCFDNNASIALRVSDDLLHWE